MGTDVLRQRAAARTWVTGVAVVAGLSAILRGSVGPGDLDGGILIVGAVTIHSVLALRSERDGDEPAAVLV